MSPAPYRVLVVDDERDLADLARELLQSCGFTVAVAYSATEALLVLAGDDRYDALFSDIMMPEMTGLQLARTVGIEYPHIRIVLTSGFTLPALLAEHGQPYRFVAKPYRIESIIRLLRD